MAETPTAGQISNNASDLDRLTARDVSGAVTHFGVLSRCRGANCEAGHITSPVGHYHAQRPRIPGIQGTVLLQKRIKVDTANIVQGMYVAQLDRSWLTTPFIKRGFQIGNEDEIGLLRKFCKHVYVDVSQSTVSEKDILKAHQESGSIDDPFSETQIRRRVTVRNGNLQRLRVFMRRFLPRRKTMNGATTGRTPMDVEAPLAMQAYVEVSATMGEVLQRVKKGHPVDIDRLYKAVAPMVVSVQRNPDAMAWLGFLRKREQGHFSYTITTAIWALIMGHEMGLTGRRLANLAVGALLLDIGNTQVPKSIGMNNGPLTDEEIEIMRMHVHYGLQILEKSPGVSEEIIEMVGYHHERLDGSGYPQGISGDIPVYGRIAGLIDCYDAMISKRPYADQRCAYDAVRELNQLAGTQFQTEVVEQFVRAIGMFPTGSLVELNTGEVAIVIEQNLVHRLRPKLMVILNVDRQPVRQNKVIDLSILPDRVDKKKACWIEGGFEIGSFDIDPQDFFLQPKGNA